MLTYFLSSNKDSVGINKLSEIYGIDTPSKFKDIGRMYLGNTSEQLNGFLLGPYNTQFMYPQEEINSIKAVANGSTDYKLDEFSYEVNEYGFRGKWDLEKDETTNSIATFGCSNTFGIGCSLENLWCEILANNLNKRLFNFGVGGTGIEHSSLIYSILSRFTRFDIVIVLVPVFLRVMFPHTKNKNLFEIKSFLHDFGRGDHISELLRKKVYDLYDETYLQHRLLYSIDLMIKCAKMNGTRIYFSSWDNNTHYYLNKVFGKMTNILPIHKIIDDQNLYARDGSHAGKISNHMMANIYTEILRADGV